MLTTAPVVAFRVMDAENNFPYPVLAITDLANNYSHEHFRFAIGNCRDVIAKVIAEGSIVIRVGTADASKRARSLIQSLGMRGYHEYRELLEQH